MPENSRLINTQKFAHQLRRRAIDVDRRQILLSRLSGSGQEVDISAPINCDGFGRVRHFRFATGDGWPMNPLPIVPACTSLGIDPIPDVLNAQVFQNSACAWRCWYCFVPDELLRADTAYSDWFTAEQLVEMFRAELSRPVVIDLSGGSPDLVPEWTVWMMEALAAAGLSDSTYLWSDDNLSTTYLFDHLTDEQLLILQGYKNYGRVCCFKGFDETSFSFNTRAAPNAYSEQFTIMRRLLDLDIDLYGYVTLTSPSDRNIGSAVGEFVDRLQSLDENLPLRVIPLQIQLFSPAKQRVVGRPDRERSLAIQEEAIQAWNGEIVRRFHPDLRTTSVSAIPVGRRGRAR
ncbi:MAG: hypothetical protein J0H86_00095 [Xanthomonadaceae bacterium]|nr:hypothetical protein [Xanthomonadaceae bacterium]